MAQPDLSSNARADYYQDYWHDLGLDDSPHLRWKAELTREHPAVRTAKSVLDVGCGSGHVLRALARPGLRRVGVEVSASAIDSLRAHGIEGAVVDLENGRLPFPDGGFDVVLCYDVLEHLFAPWVQLREIERVLAPNGRALLCVPNTLNGFNRLKFVLGDFVDVMDTSHRAGGEEDMFSNHIRLFSKGLFERFVTTRFAIEERHYYFPQSFSDPRFKLPPALAKIVTAPRLERVWPSVFALGFLYVCKKR